jgi:hypothetical protein
MNLSIGLYIGNTSGMGTGAPPDYESLTNVLFHGRFDGLVTNTDNSFGTVDVSGNVTKLKSVAPHVTAVEFNSTGTAPTLTAEGIQFGGAGRLAHSTVATFNGYSYNATLANIKGAVCMVIKLGSSSSPGVSYALFGNNGTSTTAKGVSLFYSDVAATPSNNGINFQMTRAVAQSFVLSGSNLNVFVPNRWNVLWVEWDKSKGIQSQFTYIINGRKYMVLNTSNSSSPVTTPTYGMEIGAGGNGAIPAVMTLKEVTFMSTAPSEAVRDAFIEDLLSYYNISESMDGVTSRDYTALSILNDGKYYLSQHLLPKPSDSNTLVNIGDEGTGHLALARVAQRRISTDGGVTWSSKITFADWAGTTGDVVNDIVAGYGSNGRLHIMISTHVEMGGACKLWYIYSDDDGATMSSATEMTSILPSDGLALFRVFDTIKEIDGRLFFCMYKQNVGAFSSSAEYFVYSDDNGANWSYNTIIAASASYYNEMSSLALSDTFIMGIVRNDTNDNFRYTFSTDKGATWAAPVALTISETFDFGHPPRLNKFKINGVDVVSFVFADRTGTHHMKAIYAKASDIMVSGASAVANLTALNKFGLFGSNGTHHFHYGTIHYVNDTMDGIALFPLDNYPGAGGTTNQLVTFRLPTAHYPNIKALLGIS